MNLLFTIIYNNIAHVYMIPSIIILDKLIQIRILVNLIFVQRWAINESAR